MSADVYSKINTEYVEPDAYPAVTVKDAYVDTTIPQGGDEPDILVGEVADNFGDAIQVRVNVDLDFVVSLETYNSEDHEWLYGPLTPETARELADLLVAAADRIDGRKA